MFFYHKNLDAISHYTLDCTQIMAVEADANPDPETWTECSPQYAQRFSRLWTETRDGNRITFYGNM